MLILQVFVNTALGYQSVGTCSLNANTTGASNVAVGTSALDGNTTASDNTAVGFAALLANTTGACNTAVGNSSLDSNTTGYSNTAVGRNSLSANTEGFENTVVGENAGDTITTGSNLTVLGHNAEPSSATATNEITLGDANVTTVRMGNGDLIYPRASIQNYPGFEARLSANQTISHNTATKVQCADETFDTDGYYDNVTNYRFTPLVAGKYYCYFGLRGWAGGSASDGTRYLYIKPYKNGSLIRFYASDDTDGNEMRAGSVTASAVIEFNGSSDYLEFYATIYAQNASSTGVTVLNDETYFGAYRLGD
jgi:hypothetical protein